MATSPIDQNTLLQIAQQKAQQTGFMPSPNPVLNQIRQQPQQPTGPAQIQHPESFAPQPITPPPSAAQQRLTALTTHKPALENVYGDITQSRLGQAHPVLGKILGGLAQIPATAADIGLSALAPRVGQLVPGTSAQQAAKVQNNMGLVKEEGAQREQAARAEQAQAEAGNLRSEIPLHEAQTKAAEAGMQPIGPNELGVPENLPRSALPGIYRGYGTAELNSRFKNTPQYQLGQQYLTALESGDQAAAQRALDQLKQVSLTTPQGIGAQGRIEQGKNALAEKVREFQSTDQYRRWKEGIDAATRLKVAQLSQGKAPAQMMQSAEYASGGLNSLNDARSEMAWLEAHGVMGQNFAQNKVEDWIFGKGAVDPSLDAEARYHIGKLRSAMELTSSAMLRAHTGRTSKEIYDDFKNMMGPGQDWSALSGALDESDSLLGQYAGMASNQNIQNLREGNAPTHGGETPPAGATQKVMDKAGHQIGWVVNNQYVPLGGK